MGTILQGYPQFSSIDFPYYEINAPSSGKCPAFSESQTYHETGWW